MSEGSSELPGRLDALAAAWTVLSRLLLAPASSATLDQVRDPATLAEWPVMDDAGACARGAGLLVRSAEAGEDEAAVRRDFNRLFVGPGRLKAAPYESVHRSRERLLFDAQTFEVRQWYARFGLAAPRLNREPDDHIGLELEFLATLALQALGALEEGRREKAEELLAAHGEFLADHVLAWAPGLMDLIREHAETHFHRGVADLGTGTLAVAGSAPR